MRAPLISPTWRTRVRLVCAGAATAFALLAALLAGGHSTRFDSWMFEQLYAHISDGGAATLLGFSAPALSIAICGVIAVAAALLRRWEVTALAVIAPTLTVGLTKVVLKPLLDRKYGSADLHATADGESIFDGFHLSGVFPSGHESAVAATACLLAVVAFQLPLTRAVRAALLALVAAWTVVAALGLVRNFWHYATDTIGSMLLATVVVLGVALVIDAYGATVVRRLRPALDRQLSRRR